MANDGETRRKLVRRTDDRVLGGVCSGLADHLGLDPLLVRIGFVALALTGGTGVLAYLIAWAVIPPAGGVAPGGLTGRSSVGFALLVVAGAMVALAAAGWVMGIVFPLVPGSFMRAVPGGFPSFNPEPLGFAALLVVAGVLLLRGRDAADAAPAGDAVSAARRPVRAVRRPRERSGLAPLTLAVALLVGGGAALLANAGWIPLDIGQVTALSLLIVGLGLSVGAWFGRARLLIPVAILMVPFVLVASLMDFPPAGSVGSGYLMPRRAGELEDMRVLAGQVTVDLSEYPFAEGTERAHMRVAAGSVNVYVPKDVRVEVTASVQGGEAWVLGGHEQGFEVAVQDSAGPEEAEHRLELELVAGFGSVGVYRVGAGAKAKQRRDEGKGTRDGRAGEGRPQGRRGRADRPEGRNK